MPDDVQLDTQDLEGYLEWSEGGKLPLSMYAQFTTNKDILISHAKLFFPDFVLHDEKVFWDGFNPKNYEGWKAKLHNDAGEIERMMNHVHLDEGLLQHLPEPMSDQNLEYLNHVLVATWGAALRSQFPDRNFEIVGTKQADGDYIITFWQA